MTGWHELVELARSAGFNAIWFNPFHRASELEFDDGGRARRRSLYAIRDHRALDEAVSTGDVETDRAHLRAMIEKAEEHGVCVMVDLVCNHVAVDHPLVAAESEALAALTRRPGWQLERAEDGSIVAVTAPGAETVPLLFARDERLRPLDFDGTTGYDNVQLNYASAAARSFFLGDAGAPGLWKRWVTDYLELGVRGFRCDMAFKVPASWWIEIIAHARAIAPEVVFFAETLGGKEHNLKLLDAQLDEAGGRRPAFDLVMLSTSWWDLRAAWLQEEMALAHRLAVYGGAGSPDNHDLSATLAQDLLQRFGGAPAARGTPLSASSRRELLAQVAALCVRNYAVSALVGSAVYATLGYLFCLDQGTVFWEPAHLQRIAAQLEAHRQPAHPLNLVARIAEVNAFVAALPLAEARVELRASPSAADETSSVVVFEVVLGERAGQGQLAVVTVALDAGLEVGAPHSWSSGARAARLVSCAQAAGARHGRWLVTPLLVACALRSPDSVTKDS